MGRRRKTDLAHWNPIKDTDVRSLGFFYLIYLRFEGEETDYSDTPEVQIKKAPKACSLYAENQERGRLTKQKSF